MLSDTPKVQSALKALGVSLNEVGADGQQHIRPLWDVFLDLSKALQTADESQTKLFADLAGGKYQFDSLVGVLTNVNTLQNAYNASLNSAGTTQQMAQASLHTLAAEFQRLQDAIQQLAYNAGSGGLGDVLKSIVVGLTDLIDGLQKMPSSVLVLGATLMTAMLAGKIFVGTLSTVKGVIEGISNGMQFWKTTMDGSLTAIANLTGGTAKFTADLEGGINTLNGEIIALDEDTLAHKSDAASRLQNAQTAQEEAIGVGAVTAEVEGETGAIEGATVASREFSVAAAGITMGLSLLIPIVAGIAIGLGSASQQAQVNTRNVQELTSAYDAHKEQVDALLNTYQRLDNATHGGTVFADNGQEKQYYDVMNQISQVLPNVTAFVDQNGQAHLQSADYIRQEIEQQKQLMQLKAQDTIANYKQDNGSLQTQVWIDKTNISADTALINDPTYTVNGVVKHLTEARIRELRDEREKYAEEMNATIQEIQTKNQELANAFITQSGVQLSDQSRSVLYQMLNNIDWNKIGDDSQKASAAIKTVVDTVISMQNASKDGKVSVDDLSGAFASLQSKVPMVSKSMSDVASSANDTSTATQQATQSVDLLAQASKELSDTHVLSRSTLDALIAKYPDFINVMNKGNDAIANWIKSQQGSNTVTVNAEKNKTLAVINETKNRINAMMAEMDALKALALAHQGIAGMMSGLAPGTDALNPRYMYAQQASALGSDMKQAQDELKRAIAELGYYNTTAKTGGGGSSGSGSKSSSYASQFTDLSQRNQDALESYKRRIDSTAFALDGFNNRLSSADTYLKAHITDTKAASDAVSAYNNDVKGLNDHIDALSAENGKLKQEMSGVQSQINRVNADFRAGRINATDHATAIRDLNNEYDQLNRTLNDNVNAMDKDKQAIASATSDLTGIIVGMLQTAYQDEEAIQQKTLDNIYQPQIDALQKQADAIDGVISKLREQWSAQDNVNQLTDMQNQLAAVEADKRFEIVGLDGKLTYTYDTARAAELEKQIADKKTQIEHDAQIQQLQDQKSMLDQQIKNLQDAYQKAKDALDSYWKDKLSQDNLQSEADNLILKNGMQGALGIVQKYATQIVGEYDKIQSAAQSSASAILSGLGLGGGVPSGSGVASGSSKTAPNGEKYTIWSDRDHKYYYGDDFNATAHMAGGYWQDHKWIKMATGGMVPEHMGIRGVDSVPALLKPGEIVAPSWDALMSKIHPSGSASVINMNDVRLEFPNVRDGSDAQTFVYQFVDSVRHVR